MKLLSFTENWKKGKPALLFIHSSCWLTFI